MFVYNAGNGPGPNQCKSRERREQPGRRWDAAPGTTVALLSMAPRASLVWVALAAMAAAVVAQDGGLYQQGLQFQPAPQDQSGLQPGLPLGLSLLPFGQGNPFLLQQGGFQLQDQQLGLQQQDPQQQDPQRTGPISFGPEHARPATTTPNPFRQGPLSQAALQQQHALAQLQAQQQAFAAPTSPSARYASLPQQQQQQPQPQQLQQLQQPQLQQFQQLQQPALGPAGFDGFGGFVPSAPGDAFGQLGPAPGQDASQYGFNQ